MEELRWNVLSFWDCPKVCKSPTPLLFAVAAHKLAKNCIKLCLLENKFKNVLPSEDGNHSNMIDSKLPLPPM